MAKHGLLLAAERLAGEDLEAICRTFAQWQNRSQRELPWLAGPAFSALGAVAIPPPAGEDVRVLERFLLGAETDPQRVRSAIALCRADVQVAPPQPPDARGALVAAVERFFSILSETYAQMHRPIRDGHRRYLDDAVEERQSALDLAASDIRERTLVLQGRSPAVKPPPRRVPDRAGLALGFVLLALLTAATVVWLVLQGWPMTPVPFDF